MGTVVTLEADILVVGGGTAGCVAAVKAKEALPDGGAGSACEYIAGTDSPQIDDEAVEDEKKRVFGPWITLQVSSRTCSSTSCAGMSMTISNRQKVPTASNEVSRTSNVQGPKLNNWERPANVEFGLKMRGVPESQRRRLANEMLTRIGLSEFVRHYPDQHSGGMQQRVNLARCL
jgi:ABC-type dipeptide/oligopeptide/nickel transport system ATPase component